MRDVQIVPWAAMIGLALAPVRAQAERPLTYDEALAASVDGNPALRLARYEVERAEAALVGSRGIFDPTWTASGSWFQSREVGYEPTFDVRTLNDASGWNARTGINGALATGTSWQLSGDSSSTLYTTASNGTCTFCPFEFTQTNVDVGIDASITQSILEGNRLAYNLQNVTLASQALDAANLQLKRTEQETLASVATAYWSWWYQDQLLELAQDNVAVAAEALRVVELKVASGDFAPVERTRQEADVVGKQAELIAAQQAARRATDDLLLLLGEAPGQDLLPATQPDVALPQELDGEAAVRVALAQNLDLLLARQNVDAAELALSLAKHATLPSLSATLAGSLGAQDTGFGGALGALGEDLKTPTTTVSANWSMPLGNRAARASKDQAAVTTWTRTIELEQLEGQVSAQVGQQVLQLQSSAQRVALTEANLRLAEQTLAAEQALADAGRSIQKDVLEARQATEAARVEVAKARTDQQLALVELMRLQGQLAR